ncbi:DNA-directed RNA polymerase subunit D [Methanoplanus limicola]|uniref:DNA-directed RNA polymerase subunit Rpo3 n=1 Tax=Methanoplanus limicola DSM 2279 TaxID=937775 RepID=H1YWA0_9EURY|nr:DNA-directed RNA polymerase subunit D [Methanoplanus limicola]EHQ34822.1 DNA-directed RNA polymerase, subunit D [Methanoplanus limicola DSM 2279]
MEITFSRLDENAAKFILKGTTFAFANSFRRAMITDVPTLAIEDVYLYDNNSALFDEILTHRLGLIPITTDLSEYVRRDECSCGGEGCSQCQAVFTLSVEGPGIVMSGDLVPQNPGAVPVNPDIPIVKLDEDQKVVLEARAELNTGMEHAKWQPTLACGYKAYPVITVSDRCDGCGKCVEQCPRNVLKAGSKAVLVIESRLEDCSMCRLCEKACMASDIGDEPAIRVNPHDSDYIFVVESDGSMPVKDIMIRALDIIGNKSRGLVDVLSDISGAI